MDGYGTLLTLNLRFPGQYYDQESGLNYNYFRGYDPATGRYIKSDPIGLAGGLSAFGYALSNPLFYSDPNELAAFPLLLPIVETIIQVGELGVAVVCGVSQMAADAWGGDVHERAESV